MTRYAQESRHLYLSGGGIAELAAPLSSRPLSLLAAEQAVRLERKNEQQRRKRDDVFHRACNIHPAEVFDDAEEKTAGDRAWNAAEAAEDGADESLDADRAHVGGDNDERRQEYPGRGGETGADRPDQRKRAIDIDAAQGRGIAVLGGGLHALANSGLAEEQHERADQKQREHDDAQAQRRQRDAANREWLGRQGAGDTRQTQK